MAAMLVKQAANVLELLEYFAQRRRPATLAEIADELGWPRSSAFNIVGTLVEKGYLYEPRLRAGYYPTPRWTAMTAAISSAEPLPEAATQLVEELAAETGETTAIAAPAGVFAIFIHVVESSSAIRYFAKVGHRLPIQATASGRAILSQYAWSERQSVYRKLDFERYSASTPVSIDAVEAELRRSSERGYFYSAGDYSKDLLGVSLPLPLPIRQRRLALTVAGPHFRCVDRTPAIVDMMRRAIQRFAPELGLSSPPDGVGGKPSEAAGR